MKILRYILSVLLFIVVFQAAGEEYVIEKVCLGAERRYRVDGQAGSTYTWLIDDVIMPGTDARLFTAIDPVTGIPKQGSEFTVKWAKAGVYKLSVVQFSMFNCDTLEQGFVEVFDKPVAIAGDPLNICSGTMVELTTAIATNASSIRWTSSGDGTFDNPLALHTNYHFGINDKQKGNVQLTLTAQGMGNSGSCSPATSSLSVTLKPDVIIVTSDPPSVCLPATIDLSAPSITMGSEPGLTFRYFYDRYGTRVLTNYKTIDQPGTYYIEGTNLATGCSALDSVEVKFNPLRMPSFASIGDVCLNSKAPELPPADFTGISGSWSPAVIRTDQSGISTYTFTPDPGQCAQKYSIQVNVSNEIIPTFDSFTACQGAYPPSLPRVSNNGIIGTWSPAQITTDMVGTFPYKFTPDPVSGGCGAPTTIMVEITKRYPLTFNAINLCLNSKAPQLPVVEGINGKWSPDVITTNINGNFPYTFIPDPGQCVDQGVLMVYVNLKRDVHFDPIGPLCANSVAELPLKSKEDIPGTWFPSSTIDTREAGTFTYRFVPDDASCAKEYSMNVEIYKPITVEIKYDPIASFGQTTLVTVTASGGSGTYTSGVGTYTLHSGYHTFVVTDNSGCSAEGQVYISEPQDLMVTAQVLDRMKCAGGTDMIQIHVSGGDKPYRYSYKGGDPSFIPLNDSTFMLRAAPQPYEFEVFDKNGLYGSAEPIFVTEPEGLKLTAAFTSPSCFGGNDATATVTATNNFGKVIYNWDDPMMQANATAYDLKAGTYTVTVYDDCGKKQKLTIVIPDPAPMLMTALGIRSICAGSNGKIDFTFTNVPDGKYMIIHDGGVFADVPVVAGKALVDAPVGTYTNLKIRAKGCSSAGGVSAIVNPALPVVINAMAIQPTCTAPAASIIVTDPKPNTGYQYSKDDGATWQSISFFTNLKTDTTYRVRVQKDGCISDYKELTINKESSIPQAPVIGLITQPTCAKVTGSVVLNGLPEGNWTLTRTPGGATLNGSSTSVTISGLIPGTYQFTVKNAAGCISIVSSDVVINVPPELPVLVVERTLLPVTCGSNGSILLNFTKVPDGVYTIRHSAGNFEDVVVASGKATISAPAGSYRNLQLTIDGCTTAAGINATLSDLAAPAAPVPGAITHPTCALPTGSVELKGLPATGLWTLTRVPEGIATTGKGTTTIVSGLLPGTYSFLVTNAEGCTSAVSAEVVINKQPELPVMAVASMIQPASCGSEGSILLTFMGVPDGSYTIQHRSGSFPNVVVSSGAATIKAPAGIYNDLQITVKGCVSVTGINAILHDVIAPSAPIVGAIDISTCNEANGSVVLSGLPSGNWVINPGNIRGNTETFTITGLKANTIYHFTVTDELGCTSAPSSPVDTHVPGPATPTASVTLQPNCEFPYGTIKVLTPAPAEGFAYVLTALSPAADTVTNTTGLFENLTPGGSYGIQVKDLSTGCVSTEIILQINALPPSPAAPDLTVSVTPTCNNPDGTVMVVRPRGTDYQYSMDGGPYQGSAIFAGLRWGEHTVRVRNVKTGCVSEVSKIAVPAIPPPPVITAKEDRAICYGGTGFIEFSITNVKAGTHVIKHDKGQFQVVLNADGMGKVVAPVGIYKNLTLEVGGCSSYNPDRIVNVQVTQPDDIVITASVTPINLTTKENASITLSVTGGNGNYTYSWSNGATTRDISNLLPGRYIVTVFDENNCSRNDTIQILLPTIPHAVDDNYTARCNIIAGNLILNDKDQEFDRLFIAETPALRPVHGTVVLASDGTFEYHADPLFTGIDSFKYELFDKNRFPGIYGTVVLEILPDKDRDGVTDSIDKDTDGDGILNDLDGSEDTDKDGLPNSMDIDSDGDGIPDQIEAQNKAQYKKPSFLDVNKNGVDDVYDNFQMTREILPFDSDNDELPDYLDQDSDNDGVPDRIEGHDKDADGKPDQEPKEQDKDMDGLDDGYDIYFMECDPLDNIIRSNAAMQDFDKDGLPDWRDENDDNDDFLTKYEDMDGNGDLSNDDFDYDGHPEYVDYGRECDLFIPDAFSPNEDDIHDLFQIYCINHYPNAKIYIFDQLGNKLFEKNNYGNEEVWGRDGAAWWDGIPDRGRGRGELVPPGTYYYVLDLGNGEVKKSFVFVSY